MEQAFVNICAVHGRPVHYFSFDHCIYIYIYNQKQQAKIEIHSFSIAQTFIHSTKGWVARLSEICLSSHPSQHLQVPVCTITSVFIWMHSMLIFLCSLSSSLSFFADSFLEIFFSRSAICVCNHHSPHYHCVFHIFMLTLMAVFIKCGNIRFYFYQYLKFIQSFNKSIMECKCMKLYKFSNPENA